MTDLEAHWGQFVHAVAERDAAIGEVQGIHVERDKAFVLLSLGRLPKFGLCFRLLGRQWSLIIESRNTYARLRSFS